MPGTSSRPCKRFTTSSPSSRAPATSPPMYNTCLRSYAIQDTRRLYWCVFDTTLERATGCGYRTSTCEKIQPSRSPYGVYSSATEIQQAWAEQGTLPIKRLSFVTSTLLLFQFEKMGEGEDNGRRKEARHKEREIVSLRNMA